MSHNIKKILIIETEYEGHYLTGYIKYILRSFRNQRVQVTLLTSSRALKEAKGAFKILKDEDKTFRIKIINNILLKKRLKYHQRHNKKKSILTLLFEQIVFYFLIKKEFKKINFKDNYDHIFVPSLQKIDKALVLFGSPFQNVNFSGIYLDLKFHLNDFNIAYKSRLNYLTIFFFKKLLNIEKLTNIITNDLLFFNFLKKKKWNNYDKLKFLHDPKEFNLKFNKTIARKKLCLPLKSIYVLVYGALIDSKGILELLSIFKNKKNNSNVKVILAGRQFGTLKIILKKEIFIRDLQLNKKLFIFNRWFTEKDEALLFSAADIVWVGYKNYSSPSGVLYQAVNMSLPTIISNDGSLNYLNKKNKISVPVNIYNSLEITNAIHFIYNKKNLKKIKKNIKKFSKICNVERWVLGFQKINKELRC